MECFGEKRINNMCKSCMLHQACWGRMAKRAEFVLRFKRTVQLRRFSMEAGEKTVSALIDNRKYHNKSTAGSYLEAIRLGKDRFMMDLSPVMVSDVEPIGWKCYRRR